MVVVCRSQVWQLQLDSSPAEGALAIYSLQDWRSVWESVHLWICVSEPKTTWICVCRCVCAWLYGNFNMLCCVCDCFCVCVCSYVYVWRRSEYLEPVQHSNTFTFGRFSQQSTERERRRASLLYACRQLVSMTIISITRFLSLFSLLRVFCASTCVCPCYLN